MVDAGQPGFTTLGEAAFRVLDDLDHLSRCPVTGVDTRHANAPVLAVPYETRRPTIYASRSVAPGDDEAYVLALGKGLRGARILRTTLFLVERRVVSMEQLGFVIRWVAANFGDEETQAEMKRDPREEIAR